MIINRLFMLRKQKQKPMISNNSYYKSVAKEELSKYNIKKISNWEEYLDKLEEEGVYSTKDQERREVILKTRKLNIYYKRKKDKFHALIDISLNLFHGEILGLVGESGSGKSTLGKALTKQINHEGQIVIDGIEVPNKVSRVIRQDLVKKIQMIFQDPTDSLNPYKSVGKNIIEGLRNISKNDEIFKRKKSLVHSKKVRKMINSVGFDRRILNMFPLELSGGEQQRVSIGRALLVKPKILIADEPISALDVSIQAQVINILNKLKEDNDLSIIFIAHDLRMVEYVSSRILVINQGRIVEIIPAMDIHTKAIHPYTQTLLSAVPSIDEFNINLLKRQHDPKEYVISENTSWWNVGKEHYVLGDSQQVLRWVKESIEENGL